jgi:phage terminase large subunit
VHVNPVFRPLFQSACRYNVLKGGAGAGKSRAIAQYIVWRLNDRKDFKVLAMHKIAEKIKETVFAELNTAIKEAGLAELFRATTSPYSITHRNGNKVIFMGLDDPDKLKSISGINLIWMEEADMFEEADFNQADTRLRGKCDYKHQLILSFNPTSELSWLKSTFFDQDYGDTLILESTFRDNEFLDAEYKAALERKGRSDMNFLRVYMNGEWGRVSTEGMFYKNFDSFRNVSARAAYDPGQPIWLSFDFNVQPYCACTIWQPAGEKTLLLVDEIALKSPRNMTKDVCQEFVRRYAAHRAGVFVTGDPNGRKQETTTERGFNNYTIIANELEQFRPSIRQHNKAPNIVPRGAFINDILADNYEGLQLLVNRRCTETIKDLTYQKEAAGGLKDKSKAKNADGISVEKYGHMSDTLDYLVTMVWAAHYEDHQRGPKPIQYLVGHKAPNARFRA